MYSYSSFFLYYSRHHLDLHSFPTRRSSDLVVEAIDPARLGVGEPALVDCPDPAVHDHGVALLGDRVGAGAHLHALARSEEHTSELQSLAYLVCRLLLEKKNKEKNYYIVLK